jgi:hypothetical protein
MAVTPLLTGERNPPGLPMTPADGERQRAVRPPRGRPVVGSSDRRFDRHIGFWLGGAILGTGGCILGACMPYRQPVAVTLSVLWWGIYFGCFGMNLGALLGLWAEQTPVPPGDRQAGVQGAAGECESGLAGVPVNGEGGLASDGN